MKFCIVRNANGTISTIPILGMSRSTLSDKYEILCFVNKEYNPHFAKIVKNYFSKQ